MYCPVVLESVEDKGADDGV
jgi:hypothetical protein